MSLLFLDSTCSFSPTLAHSKREKEGGTTVTQKKKNKEQALSTAQTLKRLAIGNDKNSCLNKSGDPIEQKY